MAEEKNLWKQLKSIGYSSKPMGNSKIVLDINNESCYEPKNISEHINSYFLNIASNLVNMLPAAPNMYSTNSDLFKNFYLNKNVSSISIQFQIWLLFWTFVSKKTSKEGDLPQSREWSPRSLRSLVDYKNCKTTDDFKDY